MDWQEIEDLIQDYIYLSLDIDKDDLYNLLIDKLDFSEEEADKISDALVAQVTDNEDWIKEDIAMNLVGFINDYYSHKEAHEHPEDAPWQLHLFD